MIAYDKPNTFSNDFIGDISEGIQVHYVTIDSCQPLHQTKYTLKKQAKIKFKFKGKRKSLSPDKEIVKPVEV